MNKLEKDHHTRAAPGKSGLRLKVFCDRVNVHPARSVLASKRKRDPLEMIGLDDQIRSSKKGSDITIRSALLGLHL